MFDIVEQLSKSEEGTVMEVKDLHGNPARDKEGNPVWIKLAGQDSTRWRTASDEIANNNIQRQQQAGRGVFTPRTIEEVRHDRAFVMAACTVEWSQNIVLEKQVLECTRDNAYKLYMRAEFITEQANVWVNERKNF